MHGLVGFEWVKDDGFGQWIVYALFNWNGHEERSMAGYVKWDAHWDYVVKVRDMHTNEYKSYPCEMLDCSGDLLVKLWREKNAS